MWKSLVACFNGVINDEVVEVRKSKDPKVRNRIYRDELNEKYLSTANHSKNSKGNSKCLSGDHRASPEPSHSGEEVGCDDAKRSYSSIGEKGAVRVKIVLTKQEAAQLMSQCKDQGGVLEDVVRALKRIKMSRVSVSVVPTTSCPNSWRPALGSIPEER